VTAEIALGAIVLVPIIILLVLRINATLVFLSLCLGDVLVQFVAPDANSFFQLFSARLPAGIDKGNNMIKITLLLLPVVLTAIFMIRTIKGRGRLVLNVLPAAGVGMLGALLVVPLLPTGLGYHIIDSSLWPQVLKLQNLIVSASALVCLLVLWLQRPKTGGKHSKHHKG